MIQLYIYKYIYKYVYVLYILSQFLFHYSLLQDIGYSSLCYSVRSCCLSVEECIYSSQSPNLSLFVSLIEPTFWLF